MTNIVDEFRALVGGSSSPSDPVLEFRNLIGAQDDNRTPAQRAASRARDAVETAAPVMADANRSTASGLMLGVEDLANLVSLPGRALDSAVNAGLRFVGGESAPQIPRQPQPPASALMRSGGVVEDALTYEPQTTAGEYLQTTARYVPGAVMLGGGQAGVNSGTQALRVAGDNALRYGVLPGVAEESVGRTVEAVVGEDSTAERIARPVAALTAAALAARSTGQVRPIGARETDIRHAETLRRSGVEPTVGQVTRSPALRTLEGTTGQDVDQLRQVTRAALRTIGVNADEVNPQVLRQSYDDIVGVMDDAVSGATFTPGNRFAYDAEGVRQTYINSTAAGDVIPGVGNIIDEFVDAARSGRQIPLDTLRRWRTTLGELMGSGKSSTIHAAGQLRSLIDDATTGTLRAMGRDADVEALSRSRQQFRNWLAIADTSTRPGASGGLLSPEALRQAVIRNQGRRNVAVGRTTDLGELSEATDAILRPMPAVEAGGVRRIPLEYGTGGGGALIGQALGTDPVTGAIVGGMAGAALPRVAETVIRSNALQNLMMDPRGQLANALLATGPAALSPRD